MLGLVVIAIAIAITATIILTEHVSKFSALLDVLIFSIVLGVAAVPEGLPTVVTVVLSSGVKRMAQRNALIRRLAAVETLGSANVIASDKTGTLTKNEMAVRRIITASGATNISSRHYVGERGPYDQSGEKPSEAAQFELEQTLTIAVCANNAVLKQNNGHWLVQGDPTEAALLVAACKTRLDIASLESRLKRAGEVPFSSERKRMTAVCRELGGEERLFVFSKGAPDVLLNHCSYELVGRTLARLTEKRRNEIIGLTEGLAGQALRTLAVAYQVFPKDAKGILPVTEKIEADLVFAGLVGMMDPPRGEARAAVDLARGAGIRVIMITGDHRRTAEVIAKELGIGDGRAITGADLQTVSDEELLLLARSTSVYARVNPEHKLRIVKALQRDGAIVAMTGDGVNDAPALKAADIGIAMGRTGTDVSKDVADMVLADDNFASIVAAVAEGRAIFFNIRKFLRYLLSSNVGEVLTMFFGVVLAKSIGLRSGEEVLTLPLVATQILWINLVTDGAPALALGFDAADKGVMNQPPWPKAENVINRQMWVGIELIGAVMAACTLLVLDASLPGGLINGTGDIHYAQTMTFTTLVLAQMFNVFNARFDEQSAFVGLFRNYWLWFAVLISCSLQVFVVYVPSMQKAFSTVPLSFTDWLLCTGAASSVLWLRELTKLAGKRLFR